MNVLRWFTLITHNKTRDASLSLCPEASGHNSSWLSKKNPSDSVQINWTSPGDTQMRK